MEGDCLVSKRRIYEIADELGIESKEMLQILEELGMGDLTPLNTVDEEEYDLIINLYEENQQEQEPTSTTTEQEEQQVTEETQEERQGISRPPIISVLGHIDHGKTTLLDTIRETRLAHSEAGGITQSIGAYQIEWDSQPLTFIDTPGHKAFTKMRSRGAEATDIAVLVVAADDGLMDQTFEALDHIEAAGIPMIVAVNKIDKANADPQQVLNELAQHDLTPDDWGGDTITVNISALKDQNINQLLEMIKLVSDMEDLRADPDGVLDGFIVEGHLDPRRGPLATAVIKNGTLRTRDALLVGNTYGRARALTSEQGQVEEAGPGQAVEIMGLDEVPEAGSELTRRESLSEARDIADSRREAQKQQQRGRSKSVEDLFAEAQQDTLDLIIKANSQGSVDAVQSELSDLEFEDVQLDVLRQGVGDISESDIMLAASSDDYSAVIGFGVSASEKVRERAEKTGVVIETYDVIYDLVDRIKLAVGEIVGPEYREKKIGEAEVREIFDVSSVGKVAGCYVTKGKIQNDATVKLRRNGELLFEGQIDTLKRFQEDVKEVNQDYECGIRILDCDKIQEGDTIEAFQEEVINPME